MKNFFRTIVGKTLLYITCILSTCILAVSIVVIIIYFKDNLHIYKTTEEDFKQDFIIEELRPYGESVLWNELTDAEYTLDYTYQVIDNQGNVVAETESFKDSDAKIYELIFGVSRNKDEEINTFFYHYNTEPLYSNVEYYSILLSIDGTPLYYEMDMWSEVLHLGYELRYAIYFIALIALALMIATFIALMYVSGRRPNMEGFCEGLFSKIPYDLILALVILSGGGLLGLITEMSYSNYDITVLIACFLGMFLIELNLVLGLCMSAASRIKRKTLCKNTIIWHVLSFIWKMLCKIWMFIKKTFNKICDVISTLFRNISLCWKTGIIFSGISLLELWVIVAFDGNQKELVALWLIEKVLLIPIAMYVALMLKRLQKSGIALAGGNLSYHTDTKGMFWDFKQHGNNLNSIADGMAIAVEERMKSERMKTELITNVSHDIKTPLTSIINYATLIGEESCDNPQITEYSEVLVRQSERMKRLLEDLVEASKASSGNLEVCLAPCDASIFITQASGEYEEKLKKSELTLITKQPEEEIRIMADGRRMWRVFDNLMNNICKYAQPCTRVYLSLEEKDKNAIITFKNISKDSLDMSEEELMERFTRGDLSRNTEGNGLGLSIAKSMAELQNGKLQLLIDGDLFKAVLTFPMICD